MRGCWLVIAVLAACGGDAPHATPPPDAAPPGPTAMTYRFSIFPAEPQDRPAAATPPTAYIDGHAMQELDLTFPDEAAALGTSHVAELRYGSLVVASYTVTLGDAGSCLDPTTAGTVTEYDQSLCAYDSGDLRFGGDHSTVTTTPSSGGVCTGDGFCAPDCNCSAGQRCTERVVSTSPWFSHLGCAPIGTKPAGAACTFTADPAGAYDDCAGGLACVAGTCQPTCSPQAPCATGTCGYVPGYPPEIMVCQ